MRLSNGMKRTIREEQERLLCEMSNDMTQEEWDRCYRKYQAYQEMLKPTYKISLDTIFVGAINLLGILLILNYEKVDIVRSRAMSFIMKGRA